MSNDERILERLRADPRKLIEGAFQIVEGDTQQAVPFLFREEQDTYWKNRSLCDWILKPRKRGFSALIGAEFLCDCILKPNTNAVVVAHREEDTKSLFARVVWMLKNLPFKVPVKEASATALGFTQTDSRFRVITAGAQDPGRGSDITHLHLSERAFYQNEAFLAAVEGACVKNARRVIETTANGSGTPAHKNWLRTVGGKTNYKPHFFPWWAAKEYEIDTPPLTDLDETERQLKEAYRLSDRKLAWRRDYIRSMSNPDLFPQEMPSNPEEAWLASGRMVFDWLAIEKQRQAAQEPKWRGRLRNVGPRIDLAPGQDGPLTIWEMPKEDRRYIISADIAEGLSDGAWSVADVLDVSTWQQVAQWRGHCTPYEFADVLGDLGAFYNWGTVAPEINNHGAATCGRLADLGYPNLYVRDEKKEGVVYGWETNRKTKVEAINILSHAIKNLEIKINSQATLEELKSFVYLDTRQDMGAQAGAFSDCVMSLAIGVSVLAENREAPMSQRQRFKEALGIKRTAPYVRPQGTGYGVRRS